MSKVTKQLISQAFLCFFFFFFFIKVCERLRRDVVFSSSTAL